MGLRDWFMRREVTGVVKEAEDGRKGPMAKGAIEGFKASPGWRSAVMLLVLVVEGAARQLGFESGPLFMLLHTAFGVIGVRPDEALTLGVDPAALATGLAALWFALARLWTVYRERKAAKELAALAATKVPEA